MSLAAPNPVPSPHPCSWFSTQLQRIKSGLSSAHAPRSFLPVSVQAKHTHHPGLLQDLTPGHLSSRTHSWALTHSAPASQASFLLHECTKMLLPQGLAFPLLSALNPCPMILAWWSPSFPSGLCSNVSQAVSLLGF